MSDDRLRIEYIPVDTATEWERNAKKHDVSALWKSIQKHGFKDPPKFEPALNGGKGGIVEGNGRSHILREMQGAGETPPRGVIAQENGVWLMPVVFGVDADSERAAEAYGVDHNNLVLSGGDFGPNDYAKLWDAEGYTSLLADLANHDVFAVSVDGDDIDALIAQMVDSPLGQRGGGGVPNYDSFEQKQEIKKSKPTPEQKFGVWVECESEEEAREVRDELSAQGYSVRGSK